MSIIEDVFEKLQAVKVFVSLDLENSYFHVPIEESSRKYTAFIPIYLGSALLLRHLKVL